MDDKINSLIMAKKNNSKELINNYSKALKQKYNAVCLDIDGTLTDGIFDINSVILESLSRLIKKRVPIVFVVGRGVTGTKKFVSALISELEKKYNIDRSDLSRTFALLNDGTLLLSTSDINNTLFDQEKIMVDKQELYNLSLINERLDNLLADDFERTYSYSSTGKLMNIRLVFSNSNEQVIKETFDKVNDYIREFNPSLLNLTKGIWNGHCVLQVGLSNKGIAVKNVEKIIGVPENSMLRIGDCGDMNGNDYQLLDCSQGFSVRDISHSLSGCYPVIDNDGNVLMGTEATSYLLETMNILPTICLEKADKKTYRKKYADIEKKINIGKAELFDKYNQILNNNFSQYEGFNGVFEKNIGGVIIPLFEWELIDDNNSLKQLFNTTKDGNNSHLLYTDTAVLLRGSANYYYFLKERKQDENGDEILTKEIVSSWLSNFSDFICMASNAVRLQQNFSKAENKKMLLGIFDSIRNYFLISINAIITGRYLENVMLNFEQLDDDDLLKIMYVLLLENTKIMENICFSDKLFSKDKLLKYIQEVIIVSLKFNREFLLTNDIGDYSKTFRVYREIDNFIENYITMELALSKITKPTNVDRLGICGLAYGGIELPVISKAINSSIDNVSILKFSSLIGSYRKKHSLEVRNFCIDDFGGIELLGIDKSNRYVLSDDNLLTAKTMQLAINAMYDKEINVDSIVVVRYPSVNRIDQMFMDGHGAVDSNYFFNYIKGLGFPSPYSYMDLKESYEDSLGVFDITRDKILRYLYKNHDYKNDSEVHNVKDSITSIKNRALLFAFNAHEGQLRKGKDNIPMIVHPISVAHILETFGYDDNVVASGYLHDVVEDTKYSLDYIKKHFGEDIASLVMGASEPDKFLSWEERKQHTINEMKNFDLRKKVIVCADKISNLADFTKGLKGNGMSAFSIFKRGVESQVWYFSNIYSSLIYGIKENVPIFEKYKEVLDDFIKEIDRQQATEKTKKLTRGNY